MHQLIAIVEDEPDILQLIRLHLQRNGFAASGFSTAGSFYNFLKENTPALVILDLMLPDENGLEICKKLRADAHSSDIAIIILTAKNEELDRVLGLELGADDYVTKPFSVRELIARVKAVLRRKQPEQPGNQIVISDNFSIDTKKYTVLISRMPVSLTTTEFRILCILANQRGHVFSREDLLRQLWGNDKIVLHRTVDVHIRNLREKLGQEGDRIINIRGVGYKLD